MMHIAYKPVCMCIFCFFTCIKFESSGEPIQLDKYRTFDEINDYINTVLAKNKGRTSEIIIGKSYENRDIRGIKISGTNNGTKANTAVLLDGGMHAREWVSAVAVLYTIQQLVNNPSNSGLLAGIDWYILPMLNPDGYTFTMDPYGDRLWRKNRAITFVTECQGVDLNRNFDFQWGGPGASSNPCESNYAGPFPFSEPESRALADFILSHLPQIKMYLTLHSAAQAIIYPWGYTYERPADWKELDKLAKIAAQEMYQVNATRYTVGPTTSVVGPGAGGSDDWAKGAAGIKYVYTMELPGLQYPGGGFAPPESALSTIVEETFRGIRKFVTYLKNKY